MRPHVKLEVSSLEGKLQMMAASHTKETQAPSCQQSLHRDAHCPTAAYGTDRGGVSPSTPVRDAVEALSAASPHPPLLRQSSTPSFVKSCIAHA